MCYHWSRGGLRKLITRGDKQCDAGHWNGMGWKEWNLQELVIWCFSRLLNYEFFNSLSCFPAEDGKRNKEMELLKLLAWTACWTQSMLWRKWRTCTNLMTIAYIQCREKQLSIKGCPKRYSCDGLHCFCIVRPGRLGVFMCFGDSSLPIISRCQQHLFIWSHGLKHIIQIELFALKCWFNDAFPFPFGFPAFSQDWDFGSSGSAFGFVKNPMLAWLRRILDHFWVLWWSHLR